MMSFWRIYVSKFAVRFWRYLDTQALRYHSRWSSSTEMQIFGKRQYSFSVILSARYNKRWFFACWARVVLMIHILVVWNCRGTFTRGLLFVVYRVVKYFHPVHPTLHHATPHHTTTHTHKILFCYPTSRSLSFRSDEVVLPVVLPTPDTDEYQAAVQAFRGYDSISYDKNVLPFSVDRNIRLFLVAATCGFPADLVISIKNSWKTEYLKARFTDKMSTVNRCTFVFL